MPAIEIAPSVLSPPGARSGSQTSAPADQRQQSSEPTHPQSPADVHGQAMPRPVKRVIAASLGALAFGALYLVAVRGEVMLADLTALGARVFCF